MLALSLLRSLFLKVLEGQSLLQEDLLRFELTKSLVHLS